MNVIWGYLMLISLIIGVINGKTAELTTTILESAEATIETCLKIFGTIAIWSGIMKIAEKSGVIEKLQGMSYPIVKILFPGLKKGSKAVNNIAIRTGITISAGFCEPYEILSPITVVGIN